MILPYQVSRKLRRAKIFESTTIPAFIPEVLSNSLRNKPNRQAY